jgi:hypothetical protein
MRYKFTLENPKLSNKGKIIINDTIFRKKKAFQINLYPPKICSISLKGP